MTAKVGIGVEARLDASGIEAGLGAIVNKVNQANRKPYTPVSDKTIRQLDEVNARFQQLLRVDGELRRRVKATGQDGVPYEKLDLGSMYPNHSSRRHKEQVLREYLGVSGGGSGGGGGGGGPRPPGGSGGGAWGGIVGGAAQAGMRAAGPVGGVAANALGTGLGAGAGAGLMGLMGGLLALGVGKLVGGAMQNVGQAEDNAVALDKLKRVLGDVNVSFDALKSVVNAGADNLRVTYSEAGRLASQFVRLGNVSSGQFNTVGTEIGLGGGMARAFGLDPEKGVGVLGQMRGVGVTSSTQESRKFALLIGETIGKAGAFAKADEVMDALANFATSQTRINMSVANVGGYAGMFSGMVGSGIPGMDPAGAAGLLGRVNAALSAGGAKGEASQFFTAMVGQRMGLDSLQTQVLREGGAFATTRGMMGDGSAYARYMGESRAGGDKTFLQGSIEMLNERYSGNSQTQKLMRAQAAANHLGINMNQAMALLSIQPNDIGEMQDKFGDLSRFSASGIANISKSLYGTAGDRVGIANGLLGRDDVSIADKASIRGAMGTSSEGEVLAKLSAQYEQERTTGSDIRDSKNALDNIKTNLADRLVPVAQAMRDGILFMAGKGEKSRLDVLKEIEGLESKGRVQALDSEFKSKKDAARQGVVDAEAAFNAGFDQTQQKLARGEITREQAEAAQRPLRQRLNAALAAEGEAREWINEAMKKERQLREDNIKRLEAANAAEITAGQMIPLGTIPGSGANQSSAESARLGRYGSGVSLGAVPSDPNGRLTRGYRNNNPGNLEAGHNWQGMTGNDGRFATFGTPESGYRAMGKNLLNYDKKYGIRTIRKIIGRWAPPGENNTEAYIARVSQQMGIGPDEELNLKDEATLTKLMQSIAKHENGYNRHSNEVVGAGARMAIGGSDAPAIAPSTGGGSSGSASGELTGSISLNVGLSDEARRLLRGPSEPITTRVGRAQSAGAGG